MRLAAACGLAAPIVIVALTLSSGDSAAGRTAAPTRQVETPSPAAAPRPEVVEIAATGDITLGSTPELPPDGGRSLFAGVETELRGDLVLGNLETAFTRRWHCPSARAGSTDCFSFRAPRAYGRRLKSAGFTMLNLANNHSFDYGASGQAETVAALAEARLPHTGRPGQIAYLRVGRVRLAVLGFAPYPWAQDLLDLDAARRTRAPGRSGRGSRRGDDARRSRGECSDACSPRRGAPPRRASAATTRAFAHAVVDAGADLVLGHGPHVLRGLEWYRGRLVAYSLGNFSAYRNFALAGASGVSGILQVSLAADGSWRGGRLVPVRLVGHGTPELDPNEAGIAALRILSKSDFGARGMRVAESGELSPPAAR